MPNGCIFCDIASGKAHGDVIEHDETVLAVRDINPQAPVHFLVLPFEHISSVSEISGANIEVVSRMILMANKIASDTGVTQTGYRLTINCGAQGGQTVNHLHMHLLGGRQLTGQLG